MCSSDLLGVTEVWVRCEELAFLEDVIDFELQERQREIYSCIRQNFEKFMRLANAQLDFDSFQTSVSGLFSYLREQGHGLRFLDKVQIFDDYLMAHSTNVCYLAMLLGMKLDWYLIEQRPNVTAVEAKEVALLGLGCLVHDVGKLRIPKSILDKPGRLSPEEMNEVRKHPVYGYEMVKGRIPAQAAQVVLHHHQRFDGKGYPGPQEYPALAGREPLAGRRIHVFSRIASMADVFDAATSKRVYSDAKPSVQAMAEMRMYNKGFFDPVVERAFAEIIPPFPIGTVVKLSNGFDAAVVDFNPEHPCRPTVLPIAYPDGQKCCYPDNLEIDLSAHEDLCIRSLGDVDVRPFLFEASIYRQPDAAACP